MFATAFRSPARLSAGLALLFPLLAAAESRAADCLSVDRTQVEFTYARVGARAQTFVLLSNSCGRRIIVTAVTAAPDVFGSDAAVPLEVPADSYVWLPVHFEPTAPGTATGELVVRSATAPQGWLAIALRGEAITPPSISVSPGDLEATVQAGTTASIFLDVSNSGMERIEAVTDPAGPALPRPAAGWKAMYLNTVGTGAAGDAFTRAVSAQEGIDTVIAFDGTAGTPTLEQLLAYDVVLIEGLMAWADAGTLGMVAADYLHHGGKLCIFAEAMNYNSPGQLPWDAAAYFTFANAGYLVPGGAAASFRTHPITADIGPFSVGQVLPSDGINGEGMGSPLGNYDNGYLIGAYHPSMPVVCLNAHPVEGGWSGDFPRLVANTVDYLGGMLNWLTFTKPWPNDNIFVVEGSSTRSMELKIHTYRLAPGTYQGRVDLHHNDPSAPNPFTVPMILTVSP